MSENLVIDIGNTRRKLAVFKGDQLVTSKSTSDDLIQIIEQFKFQFPDMKSAILSTVVKVDIHLIQYLKTNFNFLQFNHKTPIPIKNLYKTPETLGKDRLAAAVGAKIVYPKNNVLVIDAGSSITYEILTKYGEYMGGIISPGIHLRAKALNQFTDQLPLVQPKKNVKLIGTDTESCLQSGIINGSIAEVNSMIADFSKEFNDLKIILTGGDAIYFEKSLKYNIFASENLVLQGLNYILEFNEL